jgi:hypothetical protein
VCSKCIKVVNIATCELAQVILAIFYSLRLSRLSISQCNMKKYLGGALDDLGLLICIST